MKLLVVGGEQRKDKLTKEYQRYKKAVITIVDVETKQAETVVEYVTPEQYCAWADDPSILFKSGHIEDDCLYACTQTEVLVYALPSFKCIKYITHPWMNDVHHVRPSPWKTILVVSTGLDMVLEFNGEDELINHWSTVSENPWSRFDKSIDYRKVLTTKPHHSHPNFCFVLNGKIWVTRLNQRDAINIVNWNEKFAIDVEQPHDGLVVGDDIYFTTVDGRVLIFNSTSRQSKKHIDLNLISQKNKALGWCRGVLPLENNHCVIAFSRLRPTKWKEYLHWVKYKLALTDIKLEEPTRLAGYNFSSGTIEWECDLEPFGVSEVFSVFAWNYCC